MDMTRNSSSHSIFETEKQKKYQVPRFQTDSVPSFPLKSVISQLPYYQPQYSTFRWIINVDYAFGVGNPSTSLTKS